MKATLALAVIAAVAWQVLAAPVPQPLDEALAPSGEESDVQEREKKSNFAALQTPCSIASHYNQGYGGGYNGYNGGFSGGFVPFGAQFNGLLLPQAHISLGGHGLVPQHYRDAEQEAADENIAASEVHNQMMQQQQQARNQQHAALHEQQESQQLREAGDGDISARSSYGNYASGSAIGGGVSEFGIGGGGLSPAFLAPRPIFQRPGFGYGGPSVGLFPNSGLGGCGAIPLLMSCSPNLAVGHLVQTPHRHGLVSAGGISGGGYGSHGLAFGSHGVAFGQGPAYGGSAYRATDSKLDEQVSKPEKQNQSQQQTQHASAAPAKPTSSQHINQQQKSSSSSHI